MSPKRFCQRGKIGSHLRKARPLFAILIPSLIGREIYVNEEDKRKFEPLRHRLMETERAELDQLFQRPMKPHVYAQLKALLDARA